MGLLRHHPSGVLGFSQRCAEYPVHSPAAADDDDGIETSVESTDSGARNDEIIDDTPAANGQSATGLPPSGGQQRRLAFEEVTLAAQPGDVLVHHSYTLHSAGANTTVDRWCSS